MCSLEEAWGNPPNTDTYQNGNLGQDFLLQEPDDEELTYDDIEDIPSYKMSCPPPSASLASRKRQYESINTIQRQLETITDNNENSHIINALLYIISGIYIIYTLDMFM